MCGQHFSETLRLRSDLVADHDEEREVRVCARVVDHTIDSNRATVPGDVGGWSLMICILPCHGSHGSLAAHVFFSGKLSSHRWLLPSRISSGTTSPGIWGSVIWDGHLLKAVPVDKYLMKSDVVNLRCVYSVSSTWLSSRRSKIWLLGQLFMKLSHAKEVPWTYPQVLSSVNVHGLLLED